MHVRNLLVASAGLAAATLLSGCLVVGWSSAGGGFIWPGGLGLVVMIVLVLFFLRKR
jgi:hypothetical protein